MYQVTNISGGQLVCTLASGDTLRLDNKEQTTIKNSDLTEYLKRIEIKGLIVCTKVEESANTPTPKRKKKATEVAIEKED